MDGLDGGSEPILYHAISRVVDWRFVFGGRKCEAFWMLTRMHEDFSGCRVLSCCVMSNHFRLLLEVPPMAEGGLADEELLIRLSALYSEAFVVEVTTELTGARKSGADLEGVVAEDFAEARVAKVHARFTHRLHGVSEFMKGLLSCFSRWCNRTHARTGMLWHLPVARFYLARGEEFFTASSQRNVERIPRS